MQQFTLKIYRIVRHLVTTRWVIVSIFALVIIGIIIGMSTTPPIKPAAYKPLLATIAKGESGGNYNAYFGNSSNTTIAFTDMTLAEVMQWQNDFVKNGNPSNAVGKYQFMRTTLQGLVAQLKLSPLTKFSEPLQDYLAIKLIERRGAVSYIEGTISIEQFAHNLSQEWAALPRVRGENPEKSYYAGDGLNEAKISIQEIMAALEQFKSAH